MLMRYTVSFSFFIIVFLSSCVNYKVHYSPEVTNWASQQPSDTLDLVHTIYLIGDAGGTKVEEPQLPALKLLQNQLNQAPKESSVIFLGDNIYPNGMASKLEVEERAQDTFRLEAQLNTVKDFPGNVFFIAGNHDWKKHGLKGVKRAKKYVEHKLNNKDVWSPSPGCGDPEVVKINDNLTLILIDSQWWLSNWGNEPEMNDGCDVKSRALFQAHLRKP